MLRNLENIWSESLVNSEEFAMFAMPNYNMLEKLYSYFSVNRNIAGFSECTYLYRVCCDLAIYKEGSASSFVKKILLIKFLDTLCQITLKNLKQKPQVYLLHSLKRQYLNWKKRLLPSRRKYPSYKRNADTNAMKSIACCATLTGIVQHCSLTSTEVTRLIPKTGKRYTVSSWIWIRK